MAIVKEQIGQRVSKLTPGVVPLGAPEACARFHFHAIEGHRTAVPKLHALVAERHTVVNDSIPSAITQKNRAPGSIDDAA